MQAAVTMSALGGGNLKDLAQKIRQIGGVTENRAKLIARDQTAKLNSSLTQAQHESLGVTHYRWSTSKDERVRESHAENEGQVFSWDDPPETGHPGFEINCRCVAIPVFDVKQAQAEQAERLEIAEAKANGIELRSINNVQFEVDFKQAKSEIVAAKENGIDLRAIQKNSAKIYWKVGVISAAVRKVLNSNTGSVYLSRETLLKQIDHHPELPDKIQVKLYRGINNILSKAQVIIKEKDGNVAFFKQGKDIYKAVVKRTKRGDELFVTTIFKVKEAELKRLINKARKESRIIRGK